MLCFAVEAGKQVCRKGESATRVSQASQRVVQREGGRVCVCVCVGQEWQGVCKPASGVCALEKRKQPACARVSTGRVWAQDNGSAGTERTSRSEVGWRQ